MATIKMTKTAAGPDGPYVEGRTYPGPGEKLAPYVNAGAAVWVERDVEHAVAGPAETRGETSTFNDMTKEQLAALCEKAGIEVVRGDGKEGEPLKADYIRALSEPEDTEDAGDVDEGEDAGEGEDEDAGDVDEGEDAGEGEDEDAGDDDEEAESDEDLPGEERALEDMDKDELEALAEWRGVTVERADGEAGPPLKADYVRALSG